MNTDNMNRAADNIRILAASMVEKARSGHPGGAMGGADFVNVLFAEFLNYNPERPDYPYRDRFFLDPGHMSPMLYGVLAAAGLMPVAELENFRQWGSLTPGHPERDVQHGKPHPEPYLMGLAKAGQLRPWQTFVVENAPLGVRAAVAAGIFTIAVNTGPLDPAVLADEGAALVFPSMTALAEAWPELRSTFGLR